ncbi:MAG: VgrG-related protein [Chloroflexi bacterium]|nr:VgrG-related protein [Chloroflexota bacterium]
MTHEFTVKISGISDPLLFGDIVEIVVDTNIYLPAMFTILIEDKQTLPGMPALTHTDNALRFRIGAAVEISGAGGLPHNTVPVKKTLIKGEITAIEPIFSEDGRVLLRIRGYDRAHRLTMGRSTRTFGDANPFAATITEAQIIADIASGAGLIPKIDMSGLSNARYHYVMQYNQNDWDFLWARAQLLGYQVYVEDRTLNFVKAGDKRHLLGPSTLVWGESLSKFAPRLVSTGQVTEVTTTGWDPDTKQSVSSKASSHSSNTVAKTPDPIKGSKAIKMAFMSDAADEVIETGARTAGLAKSMAEARFAEHESEYIRASGELQNGDPFLLAGTVVTVANVGVRFSGKYYVTEAKHIYRNGDYKVKFEISGRNPYTFRHLLLGNQHTINKVDGVVVGVITNINDPQKLGRVQVKYPWMPKYKGAELGSNWARVASMGGGKDRGILFMPEVDDEVLVAFENGDVNYPYVVGVLWNKKDKPPEGAIVGGKVNQRIIQSRSGHVIVLDDTQGKEMISITDKTGKNSIEIDSKTNAMTFKTTGDFTIDAGGKLTIKSKQDMMIQSMAKAGISASTNLNLEAKTGANMKAGTSQVDLQAAGAAVKGTTVDIQANAKASVKGSAMVEIQGGMVKIN